MALSITNKYAAGSGGFMPHTTSSFTPSNNSLLVVMATSMSSFGTSSPYQSWSCSGGGLSWGSPKVVYVAPNDGNGICSSVVIYTAEVTTGASMTVTVGPSQGAIDGAVISCTVYEVTGYDTSTPIGLFNSQGAGQLTPHSGTESLSLGGTTGSGSAVFSVLVADGDSNEPVIHAWDTESPTETIAQVNGGWARVTHAYITGARSTAEWGAWTSLYGHGDGAMEVKAASSGPTAANLTNSSPVLGAPTLTPNHVLTASALTNSAPALGAPTLVSGAVDLTAANLTNTSPELGAPLEAMGAPFWTYLGVSSVVEVTTASHALVTTGLPTLQPGDLLVACIGSRIASASAMTLPTGGEWTLIGQQNNNNTLTTTSAVSSGTMAYCIRGASNPNLTFTHPAAPSVALGRIIAYRPTNAIAGKDTQSAATTATNTTAVSVAGLTTALNEELLVTMLVGGQEATWTNFDATDPATGSGTNSGQTANPITGTWQERADSNTVTGADMSLAIGDAVKSTAGATGNFTATASQGAGHVSITAAFYFRAEPLAANLSNSSPVLGPATIGDSNINTLTAATLANSAPVIGAPAFGQIHVLTSATLANSAPVLGPALQRYNLIAAALTNSAPVLGPATQRYNLSAATLTNSSPVLGAPALGVVINLAASNLANSAPVLGSPQLTLNGVMAAANLSNSSPVLGPADLKQIHVLAATNLANSSPVLGSAAITYNLVASALANSAPVLGPATLLQKHLLSTSALSNTSPIIGAPAIVTGSGMLAANLAPASPVLGPATIKQIHLLVAAALANSSPAIGAPAITQKHALTAAALTNSSPTIPAPALGVTGVLSCAPLAPASPVLGPATLGQTHTLAAAGLANSAPTLGVPTLTPSVSLGTTGLAPNSPVLGSPALNQKHALTAAALTPAAPDLGSPQTIVGGVMAAFNLRPGSPVLGAPEFRERYTLVAGTLAPAAPTLGPATYQPNLRAALLATGSPIIGSPRINPRYWTKNTPLQGSKDNTEQLNGVIEKETALLGSVDHTTDLEAGW